MKLKAQPLGQEPIMVPLTQAEQDQRDAEEAAHMAEISDYAYRRKSRYMSEIDPYMQEALADAMMEADDSKLYALTAIRAQIKLDIPK